MSGLFFRLIDTCLRCGHDGFSHENEQECVQCDCPELVLTDTETEEVAEDEE